MVCHHTRTAFLKAFGILCSAILRIQQCLTETVLLLVAVTVDISLGFGEKRFASNILEHQKKNCPCAAPFRLFRFPSIKRNLSKQKEWIGLVSRTILKQTRRSHVQSDMVCSMHLLMVNLHSKTPILLSTLDMKELPSNQD